ncbi:hypothetical protein CMO92_00745 [Candidatus Woesearchaeota archaeon]|nr:hypothetical protein [Candidatus Woesearchaeota archaeon]
MNYFFDTYALIELIEGNEQYKKYFSETVITLRDNLAEMYYFLLKTYGEKKALFYCEKFSRIVVDFPLSAISKAMLFRYANKKKKLSYIDSFGYTYALEHDLAFVTGDRAFKGMKNVEIVR